MSEAEIATAPANAFRGEHKVELGGRVFRLRPSHTAHLAIEEETGLSVIELYRGASRGTLRLKPTAAALTELIRAGASGGMAAQYSADRVSEMIFEEGLPHVLARLTIVLADMATGGRKASGEAKEIPTETEEAAGDD